LSARAALTDIRRKGARCNYQRRKSERAKKGLAETGRVGEVLPALLPQFSQCKIATRISGTPFFTPKVSSAKLHPPPKADATFYSSQIELRTARDGRQSK
jgi:hypothetical protein